jgi:sensor histidine kinase YesM
MTSRRVFKWLARVLIIDAGVAFAVPLFQNFYDTQVSVPDLFQQYLYSIIYSNLIGIPLCLVLPGLWLRTAELPNSVKTAVRGVVIVLANFFGCLVAGFVVRAFVGPEYTYWADFRRSFGISLVLSAIVVAFVSLYEVQQLRLKHSMMELKTKELERERALKLATEARLSSLEARIHPHFLFNTLNSVSALIHEDPLRAEKIVTQLAELLRFSLDAAPRRLVPLARELHVVEDYLEIEKARFGARLEYSVDVPAEFLEIPVPPLSLQTLVENSVKHAVGPRGRGAQVSVRARRSLQHLRLEVRDDGPGFASLELPSGHGLNNLGERLAVLFGEQARLDIRRDDAFTVVAIEIPLAGASSTPGITEEATVLQ